MEVVGTPVSAVVDPPPVHDGAEGFALNFENTPVATVAKVVLGDILNVGYVIDPRAQGTISLSSGRPVPRSDMLFVLENALRVNNLVLIRAPLAIASSRRLTERSDRSTAPTPVAQSSPDTA